jgi:hypothetical protein
VPAPSKAVLQFIYTDPLCARRLLLPPHGRRPVRGGPVTPHGRRPVRGGPVVKKPLRGCGFGVQQLQNGYTGRPTILTRKSVSAKCVFAGRQSLRESSASRPANLSWKCVSDDRRWNPESRKAAGLPSGAAVLAPPGFAPATGLARQRKACQNPGRSRFAMGTRGRPSGQLRPKFLRPKFPPLPEE